MCYESLRERCRLTCIVIPTIKIGWYYDSLVLLMGIQYLETSSLHWDETQEYSNEVSVILTHWGRVTHIYVNKLTIIYSDNGLSPGRRQAIIWTNAGILLIGPLGTNLSEIVIEIQTFSLRKMRLKMSSAKRQPFGLGLNVLTGPTETNWSNVVTLAVYMHNARFTAFLNMIASS